MLLQYVALCGDAKARILGPADLSINTLETRGIRGLLKVQHKE